MIIYLYCHFFPSIMIMWYPNLVLIGGSVYVGRSGVLGSNLKAASWNGPTIEPLVIHPRSPYVCVVCACVKGECVSTDPLPSFVLAIVCGHFAEPLALLQLAHCLHSFRVLFTENVPHFHSCSSTRLLSYTTTAFSTTYTNSFYSLWGWFILRPARH